MQCLILKWGSKDEFWDFKFSSDISFFMISKVMEKKATKKIICDKGQNSCYDVDFSGALVIN